MRPLPAFLIAVAAAACGHDETATAPAEVRPSVGAMPAGTAVPPGDGLQAAIDTAADGAVLQLAPGGYRGPVTITRPLTLRGPVDAIVRGDVGSTIRVTGKGVRLEGFTVAGSGRRFDLMDGGIHLQGEDHVVQGITVRESLFGILAESCERVHILGSTVIGVGGPAMGLRGDGIRLWETSDSEVIGNRVRDARDLVVWYSSRNHLADNVVHGSRYGTHFMYSHDNHLERSSYIGCEVGVFVMYSHGLTIDRCLLAQSGGAAGIGLGLKESGDITLRDSWLLANTVGIYIDHAPLDPTHQNRYANNVVRFSESAVSLHASVQRSEFVDNEFRDNGAVVKVGGQGDALGCNFAANYYDSYRGYDLDGDGRGDVPFEFRRLSTQLEGRYPDLALMHGAPAMGMVDLVGELMPLFQPKLLLVDAAPRQAPKGMSWSPEASHAR